MKSKLTAWKDTAASVSQPAHTAYLRRGCNDGPCRYGAGTALCINYDKPSSEGSGSLVLCHQDYGKGNALSTADGIISSIWMVSPLICQGSEKNHWETGSNLSQWCAETITNILGWYSEVNPQSRAETEILLTDLLYPHWYYGLVKNRFQNEKPLKTEEIERAARLEESKVRVLSELLKKG